MTSERKKLYLYAGVNLVIGVLIGIVLFYGQQKNEPSFFQQEYSYSTEINLFDVLRTWWMNIIWMLAVILAQGVLSAAYVHIILAVRGCVSSFTVMYMLKYIGLREVFASVLPQCFSSIVLIWWFSVMVIEKRRILMGEQRHTFSLKRSQILWMFFIALAAAMLEAAFFRILCTLLF